MADRDDNGLRAASGIAVAVVLAAMVWALVYVAWRYYG